MKTTPLDWLKNMLQGSTREASGSVEHAHEDDKYVR
jgi:hypothetical protein